MMIRGFYPTRFGHVHVRSHEGKGVPLVLLHCRRAREQCGRSCRSGWPAHPRAGPLRVRVLGRSSVGPFAGAIRAVHGGRPRGRRNAGTVDLLGMHVGSIEAIEIAHHLPHRCVGWRSSAYRSSPPEEQQRHLEKYSEQPLQPLTDGGHVLAAWRGGFALRDPPYDLPDTQRRFVEHVLAANPGAAFRAACGYSVDEKLKV